MWGKKERGEGEAAQQRAGVRDSGTDGGVDRDGETAREGD